MFVSTLGRAWYGSWGSSSHERRYDHDRHVRRDRGHERTARRTKIFTDQRRAVADPHRHGARRGRYCSASEQRRSRSLKCAWREHARKPCSSTPRSNFELQRRVMPICTKPSRIACGRSTESGLSTWSHSLHFMTQLSVSHAAKPSMFLPSHSSLAFAGSSSSQRNAFNFFLESSFITHSTEEKTRFGPKAAARSVRNSREEHPNRCWPRI